MRKTMLFGVAAVSCAIAIAASASGDGSQSSTPAQQGPKPIVLKHAQRFTLDRPAVHWWRAEHPEYTSGWLIVLAVDPQLVVPRNDVEPVLYVGDQTAERVNQGDRAGRVVAIVPGDAHLADAEIFFGSPGFPETIDAERIARERTNARADGVRVPGEQAVRDVRHDELRLDGQFALFQKAIDLVEVHSPQEQELIRSARVPQAK